MCILGAGGMCSNTLGQSAKCYFSDTHQLINPELTYVERCSAVIG
jgi:hypothetical protein